MTVTEPSGMTTTDDPDATIDNTYTVTTTSGIDITDADFGLTGTGTIGDTVFEDLNTNGVYELGTDVLLDGVTVTATWAGIDGDLSTTDDNVTFTTTTVSGDYSFGNLPAGSYSVDADETTTGLAAPTATTDDPALVTLAAAETNNTIDFGYFVAATVSDFVWDDLDGDGVQDAGEPGIENVTVNLVSDPGIDGIYGTADDVVVATDTTDATGAYSLTAIPGDYTVVFFAPADYLFTTADLGGDDTADSDALVTADPTVATADVSMLSGVTDTTVDAGLFDPITIGDFVWVDLDNDGLQDAGEPAWEGMTVTLTGTDGAGNAVSLSTTTAADGSYLFANVAPGSYTVTFDPTGVVFTTADAGADDTVDSDANATTGEVAVTATSGGDDVTVDAGIARATIGDYIWDDLNGDGLQNDGTTPLAGVTVSLYADDGTTLLDTAVTDADGLYSFTVAPGDYVVDVDETTLAAGSVLTTANEPLPVTVVSGETFDSADFGYYTPATISDFVWVDTDGDGEQDITEAGLAGVVVNLYDAADLTTPIATTTAVAGGLYEFTGLTPGDYVVGFVAPAGDVFTLQDATIDQLDSDADPTTGLTATITLTSGEVEDTVDAGLFTPIVISGTVLDDNQADGIQDGADVAIVGIRVELWEDTTGDGVVDTMVAFTTTDANGDYTFADIPPGDYAIVVDTTGYLLSPQDAGADDAIDSDIAVADSTSAVVTYASGDSGDIDGLLFTQATISDLVWDDLDADGVQDAGEVGLAGVTVHLYDPVDLVNPIATTTTDADGFYSFSVDPGTYVMGILAPAGSTISPQDAGADDSVDSDADVATGQTGTVTVTSGETNDTVDAGVYFGATISDVVWDDLDGDGIQDAESRGLRA